MRERVLVDTDVFSYMLDDRPDLDPFRPYIQNKTLCLSFISIGELFYGAYKRQWGEIRFNRLRATINRMAHVPYEESMPDHYGRIVAECGRAGRPIAVNDAWIAATALTNGIPLVSNNYAHFSTIAGLVLLHPKLN